MYRERWMTTKTDGRRNFLKHAGLMGSAAMMSAFPHAAMALDAGLGGETGTVREEILQAPARAAEKPKYHIKFGVCGMSHDHIYGMIGAVQRGGGELVIGWAD